MTSLDDYPTEDDLRENFYVKWKWSSIGDSDDFRVVEGLSDDDVAKLVELGRKDEQDKLAGTVAEARGKLYKVVMHLRDTLKEYQGTKGERLHKSTVDNVAEMVSVLRKLNITGNKELDEVMDELENNVLGDIEIDRLKVFQDKRNEVVRKVDEIVNNMSFFKGIGQQ